MLSSRLLAGLTLAGAVSAGAAPPSRDGLLFYLSGEHGLAADFAANGKPEPNFASDVTTIPDGARGAGIRCFNLQRLSYWAAGNVYAQRGTLAFFWRSRDPVGATEFPIFRIGYADHSSWDMVWLRIDYNGHGFDAFVTDASLARVRVSYAMPAFPKPDAWVHLAFTWDETSGVRLFVNGRLAAAKEGRERLDAALDQFGPHSRIIGPWQVQSDYNFIRGGDIDEVRIYDHALPDATIPGLASDAGAPAIASAPWRSMNDAGVRDEWWLRYGFDQAVNPPPPLPVPAASVRKVEIHDAYDLKRWWWKANDGIRETTWPGVYNRSRLPGRNDYFQLPDWDCYSVSGRAITFTLPDEPWNHVEFSGAAWGRMSSGQLSIERPAGHERTTHRLAAPLRGGKLRFENTEPETPIGELGVYSVTAGREPEAAAAAKRAYRLSSAPPTGPELAALAAHIAGRHPVDERATLVARPLDASPAAPAAVEPRGLPLVHVLIPADAADLGLDGIAIDLPALRVKPTHGDLFPLNVQVKDPLWPLRDMLDFNFSVRPGQAQTLWLDTRDRVLPAGKGLYLTIAGAGADFGAESLSGAELRLVFKPREAARAEHALDRFTQARDSYAMLVEEHPRSPKLNLWVRFDADLRDLQRVEPDHLLGRQYFATANPGAARPPFQQPAAPPGVPLWAFRQVEMLERAKSFVTWYVDHRQIENGEMGGGLSDDTDLTNMWPGMALMGAVPDKLLASLRRVLDACYANGMFTHGLPTIQADELHSYEEGINALGQSLILDYGNPRQLERAMETTRGVLGLTGINAAGHRHFRSSYFSGTKVAEDGPWGWSKPYSYLVLQPAQLLVDYNGAPDVRRQLVELADGLLAHSAPRDGRRTPGVAIHFETDAEADSTRPYFPWPLYWTAWRFSGERRFLSPLSGAMLRSVNANALDELSLRKDWKASGGNEHVDWQLTGDKRILERLYAEQIERADQLDYINTEGSLWIDRVGLPTGELQRARLGGIALVRNATFPGHAVSWRFHAPATERSLGILIPDATPTGMKIVAYNLDPVPVRATLTGWNVAPGRWRVTQGLDANGDDEADAPVSSRVETFERSGSIDVTFPPRVTSVIQLRLETPGVPYWERPDLGISREDVRVRDGAVDVVVHSLGSIPAPATTVALVDTNGRAIASASIASLAAPVDLVPRIQAVTIPIPGAAIGRPLRVVVDPNGALTEITRRNNVVELPAFRWVLDQASDVGGVPAEVIGKPVVEVKDGLTGVRFDGAQDGLVVPSVPIAGRAQFTIEAQIRPDAFGPPEQRFLHIEDAGGSRALLETRLDADGRWTLDSFLLSGEHRLALLDHARTHPSGGWHWVALRYDGKTMSHFVDGTLELSGPVEFAPMLDEGRTSLGVRLNRIYWFAGAIRELRFHEEALPPEKLQR